MSERQRGERRSDFIKRRINEKLAQTFQDQTAHFEELAARGLLDEEAVAALATDPLAVLRSLKQRGREIREQPSTSLTPLC